MAAILDRPLTYRGLALQGHFDAVTGQYDRSKELETYVVEQFDFAGLQVRDQREGLHLDTGGLLGPANKQFRRLSLRGSIRAESGELLEDMAAKLYATFDVENAQQDEPQYQGVHELDFYTPTEDSVFGPVVREMFLARPVGHPQLFERRSTGFTMSYRLELICPDPRRYLYDLSQLTFSDGLGWAARTLPNWDAEVGAETYPYLLLNLSGQGESNFTITDDNSGRAFVLDLSSQTSDIAVDMQTMEILRNSDGARRDYLRTSSVNSWLSIPAGGTSWTMTNTLGVTEVLVGYRQARS